MRGQLDKFGGGLDFMAVVDPNYWTDKLGFSVKSYAVYLKVVNGEDVELPDRMAA